MAVSHANRLNHGVLELVFTDCGQRKTAAEPQVPQRCVPIRKLFRVEGQGDSGAVCLHFDFFFDRARFAVIHHEGVFAGRNARNRKVAVTICGRMIRMIEHAHVGEHPRMHIALETEEHLGVREHEVQRWAFGQLSLVGFLVSSAGFRCRLVSDCDGARRTDGR